ncbi:ABC transporter, transmembrane region [Planktothrix serta PCC 8927]|uniref:ABC transporter, transmembrane region n=1 Tax=Planktothrix serta PCC 8927 TaxID=671068 RepID=A0A7Z9BVT8_9CYAN|nr:ABC transporter ATP-binding protein [Planktothrix serta]VXD23519.1 ABC transporter, transmembrane region [Planktothrix serta PCC 8927]
MATFRDLGQYYRQYLSLSILSISASSAFELIDLIVPYTIGQTLNVLSGQPVDRLTQYSIQAISNLTGIAQTTQLSLGVLLGLIFCVTVVKAPIQPLLGLWYHWLISLKTRRNQYQNALEKILTLPLEFYDENNPGRIASRVTKGIYNQTWTYPEIAGQLIPKLIRILGIIVIIAWIAWPIAIFFLLSFLLILTFSLKSLKRLIDLEEIIAQHEENTESRNSEIITNIKTVKAFATESQELKRQLTRLNREFKVTVGRIHRGYIQLTIRQATCVQFSLFMVLGFTLAATISGHISLGYFVTIYTLASMAYSEITPISNTAEVFARRYASMIRLHEFMQLPTGQDAGNLTLNKTDDLSENSYQFNGKIEFSQVSFSYNPNTPVLQDINLLIEPYETVALVGRSGSGKSTLVKLLFRYFEPHQGQILIDGIDIRSLNVTGYRKRLAIVHQEVDIFNGTLLENLTYGNPNATFTEVKAACKIAKADEFIQQLAKGYFTPVGERGVRLSGGQKQRLGIARALLVNPDILIFDEATSSLDYESERAIQLAMQNILGTRTTIIIAHRLSTIREADQIVVLDQGQIVEVGTHEALLQHQGIYQRLHKLQETGELLV